MSDELKNQPKKHQPKKVPDAIRKILEGTSLPPGEIQKIEFQIASFFRGPVPPPDLLKEYDEVVKNGAERLFKKFEEQSAHRMELEKLAIREQLSQSRRGQIFGFILGIIGLGISGLLAYVGESVVAGILASTTIVGLVAVFVYGRSSQKRDSENKQ